MKRIILILTVGFITLAAQAQISFGNYVYEDKTSESRQKANDAIIKAAQRYEENSYRTYEDIYSIKHPEQCTFESYTENNGQNTITYYMVTIPELGISVECKYPSFERKRIYFVRLLRNGNGKIIRYILAE